MTRLGTTNLKKLEQGNLFESAASSLSDADMAHWPLDESWEQLRSQFLASPAGKSLGHFLSDRLAAGAKIYPARPFHALELTALPDVRVVILGQDPYHGAGQAHGLAFSVLPGRQTPPSLRNISKELARDVAARSPAPDQARACVAPSASGVALKEHPSLSDWARQGVLLLNTCLTVEDAKPASHAGQGWESLTDAVIQAVNARPQPVVFMLWGSQAQAKEVLIDASRHLVLTANHPSPLSANRPPKPFLGCGHFSQANAWLQEKGHKAIRW
jgi:uracil-DNA glycosylase